MLITISGIRRSNLANTAIVSITLLALGAFIIFGIRHFSSANFSPFFWSHDDRAFAPSFLEAAALLFVAFTGYGRVATLGEEIADPERNIPRAIVATLGRFLFPYIFWWRRRHWVIWGRSVLSQHYREFRASRGAEFLFLAFKTAGPWRCDGYGRSPP